MKRFLFWLMLSAAAVIAIAGCTGERSEQENTGNEYIPVTTAKIRQATLHGYVTAYGAVEPEPGTKNSLPGFIRITAPATGVIAKVNCSEYQHVHMGQILFVFDTTIADARVSAAENSLTTAEKALVRQNRMKSVDAVSEKQLLDIKKQVESARSNLLIAERERALLEVKAPISGIVRSITARIGETVNASDVIASILNKNRLVVVAKAPAAEIEKITAGQPVIIYKKSAGSATGGVTGIVRVVGESIDPENDAVDLLVSLPADAPVLSGQFVKVLVTYAEHADCLAVPSESVVVNPEGSAAVYTVTDGMAVKYPVITGFMENGLTEIYGTSLTAETTVVLTGAYGLPDSSRVRITN